MTPTRAFLVCLGVFGAVAALILLSVGGDDREYSEDNASEIKAPGWVESAFGLIGPFVPRLELGQTRIQIAARSGSKRILVTSSDKPFRRAAWLLRSGAKAVIRYEAEKSDLEKLKKQELELTPGDDPKSLAILPSGGKIWFQCEGDVNCVVELVD